MHVGRTEHATPPIIMLLLNNFASWGCVLIIQKAFVRSNVPTCVPERNRSRTRCRGSPRWGLGLVNELRVDAYRGRLASFENRATTDVVPFYCLSVHIIVINTVITSRSSVNTKEPYIIHLEYTMVSVPCQRICCYVKHS